MLPVLFGAQTHCGPSEKNKYWPWGHIEHCLPRWLGFLLPRSEAGTNNPGLIITDLVIDSTLETTLADSSHGWGLPGVELWSSERCLSVTLIFCFHTIFLLSRPTFITYLLSFLYFLKASVPATVKADLCFGISDLVFYPSGRIWVSNKDGNYSAVLAERYNLGFNSLLHHSLLGTHQPLSYLLVKSGQ